jgi:hypothetical protein
VNSFPNVFTFTFDVVSNVSLKFTPERKLSLRWVTTLTCPDAAGYRTAMSTPRVWKPFKSFMEEIAHVRVPFRYCF